MANPKAIYPRDTVFEERIHENESDKKTVAEYVVSRFLGPGQSAFVSDGSSTFFVALSIFEKKREGFRLYTNSLPIAHEYPLWETENWPRDFSLDFAGGIVNSKLMMTGHQACEDIVQRMASRAQWTILSVRCIFGAQGPAGQEPDSLAIKQASVRAPKRVILIADHTKLSVNWSESYPLVYTEPSEWESLMKCQTTYVVTSLPPRKSSDDIRELGRMLQQNPNLKPEKEKKEEWYAKNTWPLRMELGKRFIELEQNDP